MVGEKKFSFSATADEELKEFWQKQRGHFKFCIAPKLRLAKKNFPEQKVIVTEAIAKSQKIDEVADDSESEEEVKKVKKSKKDKKQKRE